MKNLIPYSTQFIDNQDIKLVTKVLKSNIITTGPIVTKLEQKLKKFFKVNYVISCNSGTSALYLAFKSIDIKKGDNVIISAINFIASFNLLKTLDANVFLADVDSLTGQLTPKTLLECIKKNKIKKLKAFVTMYLGGYCDYLNEFYKLKKKFNCLLIEDACHALGAQYYFNKKFIKIGSCLHSDISTFSLHPLKTITSGEGGIITTNNKALFNKIKLLRSHGIKRSNAMHWNYDVVLNGFNFRLSDINCALALGQLSKINKFITYRHKVYNKYLKKLSKFSGIIDIPSYFSRLKPSYHLFIILIDFKKLNISKNYFIKYLFKKKIMAQYHYIPLYEFKVFNKNKIKIKNFKNSQNYYNRAISLPIYYNLGEKKHNYIINNLEKLFNKHAK